MSHFKPLRTAIAAAAVLASSGMASAVPTLQLGISGGVYDWATQTIISSGPAFTLYAFLSPDRTNTVTDTYFISAALSPQTGEPGGSFGSFSFAGSTVNVTGDMVYGRPPLETLLEKDPGDLAGHGIFDTYFKEFGFMFNAANKASFGSGSDKNNTQDFPDLSGLDLSCTTDCLNYAAFTVDVSSLDAGKVIHFDLYNSALGKGGAGDIDVTQFAPFSHDAQSSTSSGIISTSSGPIPTPGSTSLALLGLGLMAGSFLMRRKAGQPS